MDVRHSCKSIINVSSASIRHQAIAFEFLFEVAHKDVRQKGAKRGAHSDSIGLFVKLTIELKMAMTLR